MKQATQASSTQANSVELQHNPIFVSEEIIKNRRWFMAIGVLMVLLGIGAIFFPFIAALTLELMLGWLLVINGIATIFGAFSSKKWSGFSLTLLGALLSLAIGAILILFPLTGMLSITLIITIFFLLGGILKIIQAFRLRPYDHWNWVLFSGIVDFVLAAFILSLWPLAAVWVIGVLIGIDLIFAGWISIALANKARHAGG